MNYNNKLGNLLVNLSLTLVLVICSSIAVISIVSAESIIHVIVENKVTYLASLVVSWLLLVIGLCLQEM